MHAGINILGAKLRVVGHGARIMGRIHNYMSQIKDMGELDQVNAFSNSLKLVIKQKVKYQVPATIEETWKLAVRYDIAMFGEEKVTKSNSKSHSHCEIPHREQSNESHSSLISMELDN